MPGSYNLISQSSIMDKGVKVECVNYQGPNLYDRNGTMVATALQVEGLFLFDQAHSVANGSTSMSTDSDPEVISMTTLRTARHATARGSSQLMASPACTCGFDSIAEAQGNCFKCA